MAELMYKIANEEAPDIRIIRPDIPERLANVVALSLSKRSETRYQDGDQFAADLRSVQAEVTGVSTSTVRAIAKGVVMRPDEEVNLRVSEKTAAFSATPLSAAAEDSDKTVVIPAAKPAPAYEATVVAGAMVPAGPGYDATHPSEGGEADEFAKTAVFSKPAALPGAPVSGEDKTDPKA
jgi:serine/threonine-protein kinase